MGRGGKASPLWPGRTLELSQETQGGNDRLQGANPTFAASLGMWCPALTVVPDAFQGRLKGKT